MRVRTPTLPGVALGASHFSGLHGGGAFMAHQKDPYPSSRLLLLLSSYFHESLKHLSSCQNCCVSNINRGNDTFCAIESLQTLSFALPPGGSTHVLAAVALFGSSWQLKLATSPALSDETHPNTPTTGGSWQPFFQICC